MPETAIDGTQNTIGCSNASRHGCSDCFGPGYERPAIVTTRTDDVDFVAAIRAILVLPDVAGARLNGETQRVPVAEGIHFRFVAGASDERVVARHCAVVAQPQHFARVAVRILCAIAASPAGRHEKGAVETERDAGRSAGAGTGDENVAHVGQRAAVETSPRQRERRLFVTNG